MAWFIVATGAPAGQPQQRQGRPVRTIQISNPLSASSTATSRAAVTAIGSSPAAAATAQQAAAAVTRCTVAAPNMRQRA
ncbi:hypothetical protein ACFQY4_27170 [Catellatospora bangladeshensis]|uniref:hypothetical protein n=1 Tax=Catellatospora bangladeshensis TaxID=310355 RepID=UPI0036189121